jgi:hypothetical protein
MLSFGRRLQASEYKSKHSLDERKKQSEALLAKHVTYIPVIVECDESMGLKKHKFLVPHNVNCSHIMIAVRSQLKKVSELKSLFLFMGDEILCPTENTKQAYERYLQKHSDGDKFMYIYLQYENTFGGC